MSTENQIQESMYVENQLAEPKSSAGIFDLPCGYLAAGGELYTEVHLREITGNEEDMLASKSIPAGKKITQLIANCTERLGPIVEKHALVSMMRELPIGDRVFLMLAIRRVSLGDEFPFEAECPIKECAAKHLYMVDLGALGTKPMPDPKQRVFDITLPSGKTARYHVMTGKEEETLSKVGVTDQASAQIIARVDQIEGKPADMKAIKSLGLKDRNALRAAFDTVEGGVDTGVDLTCESCGEEFKTDIDVSQSGFFFPSRVQKTSKRNTSSS